MKCKYCGDLFEKYKCPACNDIAESCRECHVEIAHKIIIEAPNKVNMNGFANLSPRQREKMHQ